MNVELLEINSLFLDTKLCERCTGCSLIIVFFPRMFKIFRPLACSPNWAAFGCTKNRSANKSDCTLRSLAQMSYSCMQGMSCRELGKKQIFMNTLFETYENGSMILCGYLLLSTLPSHPFYTFMRLWVRHTCSMVNIIESF